MSTATDPAWGWGATSDEEEVPSQRAQRLSREGHETNSETEPLLHSYGTPRMAELSSSTSRLVESKPAHANQVITALAGTLGSLAMGAILGYSSPASPDLQEPTTAGSDNSTCSADLSYSLDDNEISLFSSLVNIGALIGVPLGGFLMKAIGRKLTMVATLVPFLLGWLLIEFATSFGMLITGRIFCGVCCGVISISVPTYIGEIASADIRGMLGTGFQLMVVTGILYSYAIGSGICWNWLALACLIPGVIFCVSMFFSPESPTYLVYRSKDEQARQVLVKLRGKNYNVMPELDRLKVAAEEERGNKASPRDLGKPYVLKPLLISLALMFFQQTSGVNAILFNLNTIFEKAHSSMSTDVSSILVALVQVIMTVVGAVLIDKAGRKILLLVSSAVMTLSLVAMGTYFYLDEQGKSVESLGWLPLTSLIVFISFFSIGYGPVPWVIMGELFTADVREMTGTLSAMTNWSLSFIITMLFTPMQKAIGDSGVYWLFAALCVVNFVFCFFVVEETKGKTIEEITAMFGGPSSGARSRNSSRRSGASSRAPSLVF